MDKSNKNCIALYSIALIIVIHLCEQLLLEVVAVPPSFSYEEIKDEPFDWIDMNNKQRSISQTPAIFGHPYTDILSANYFSNGTTLDGILWFKYLLNKTTLSSDGTIVNYGLFVDADDNTETGVGGIDYQVEMKGQNGSWTRTLSQWSSLGTNRTLSQENYTRNNFVVNNGSYVLLSADLNAMGLPEKYKVIFYAEQIKDSEWLIDATSWIHIPQPDYSITLQSSVDLSQGDNKTILVHIKSATGFEPLVTLYTKDYSGDFNLTFSPKEISVPSYGMNTSQLFISVPSDAEIRSHAINVLANATFPLEPFLFPSSQLTNSSANENFKLPPIVKSEVITKQADITIDIATNWERLLQWLNKWQFPITFVSGIIIGNIGPWIFRNVKPWFLRKIERRKKKEKDDRS